MYITSGLKFGGDFLAYPGDPMRFHSHHIVMVRERHARLKILDIINMGRLATNAKKTFILASSSEDEKQVEAFSIQWAGFWRERGIIQKWQVHVNSRNIELNTILLRPYHGRPLSSCASSPGLWLLSRIYAPSGLDCSNIRMRKFKSWPTTSPLSLTSEFSICAIYFSTSLTVTRPTNFPRRSNKMTRGL